MVQGMTDDRIAALEQLGHVQNATLLLVVDHLRASALLNAALLGTLDDASRDLVRRAALAGLGDNPEHQRAATLIEEFTRDPAAVVAGITAASLDRLQ